MDASLASVDAIASGKEREMNSKKLSESEIRNLKFRADEATQLLLLAKTREIELSDFEDHYVNWQMIVADYKEAKYFSYLVGDGLTDTERSNIATMYEYACVRYTPRRGAKPKAGGTHWEKYYEYIRSVAWAEKRKEALERAKYRCQLCGITHASFEVHHNTYLNLGNEAPEDLIVLCVRCHDWFHNGINKENK